MKEVVNDHLNAMDGSVSDSALLAWIVLNRLPKVGPAGVQKILAHFKTPEHFFREKGFNSPLLALSDEAIQLATQFSSQGMASTLGKASAIDLEWLNQENQSLITIQDPTYPQKLKHIPSPPPLLYVKGDSGCLNNIQLGMVGSRSPTTEGMHNAMHFAYYLTQKGITITSGLALGIDGAAHQGALKSVHSTNEGAAPTVAVVGNGLDNVYPKRHESLSAHIIETGGAIVSEFPVGTPPKAQNFPRRNRIISGLSVGVLVVEATLKSGSLITARYATEQDKEVYAIPGSIHSPQSRGTHHLIRQGAKLVECVDDLLEELPYLFDLEPPKSTVETTLIKKDSFMAGGEAVVDFSEREAPQGGSAIRSLDITENEKTVLDHINNNPKPVDIIVSATGFPVRKVVSLLSILEIKNLIVSKPGGFCKILV